MCGCSVVPGSRGLRGGCHHDKEVLLLWQRAPSSHQHRSAAEYSSIFPTTNKAKREREKRAECLDEEGRKRGANPKKWGQTSRCYGNKSSLPLCSRLRGEAGGFFFSPPPPSPRSLADFSWKDTSRVCSDEQVTRRPSFTDAEPHFWSLTRECQQTWMRGGTRR